MGKTKKGLVSLDGYLRYILYEDCAEIEQIYTIKSHRQEGIATEFLNALKNKVKRIIIFINPDETSPITKFLIASGFQRQESPGESTTKADGIIWELKC